MFEYVLDDCPMVDVSEDNDLMHRAYCICLRLHEAGFRCVVVGGAVRDMLMGVAPKDIDLATNADHETIVKLFPDAQFVGKSFGVYLVDGFELARFRRDYHEGIGDSNCSCDFESVTLEEDLLRRDFTINAMALDFFKGNGHVVAVDKRSQSDLENMTIRFVGSALKRIEEDPNRMLRACRFAAKGFQLAEETEEAIFLCRDLMLHVAPERVRLEVLKAMASEVPSRFFESLMGTSLIEFVMPEMIPTVFCDGGKFHNETVFEHLMMVGDYLPKNRPLLRLAGYLHDIGKPVCEDNGSFVGHEKVGCDIIYDMLTRLKFSTREIDFVKNLCLCHMREFGMGVTASTNRRTLTFLNSHGVCIYNFLRLRMADHNGNKRHERKLSFSEIKKLVEAKDTFQFEKNTLSAMSFLKVSGKDVMEHMNLESGPKVGMVLKHLFNFAMENPSERNTVESLYNEMTRMMEVED